MTKYLILCVDDEREVLDSVLQDLMPFEKKISLLRVRNLSRKQNR